MTASMYLDPEPDNSTVGVAWVFLAFMLGWLVGAS